ncbi:MerR family transcriptional regulator [Sutcliffiella cohnii]|uniref:MerR family transcriptional regulator n=1 Tax=Sutcliffiella cohnii TaxID=33932 RepID=UPI002E1B575D|nr:MerR family transcriptional regulator [Sutcliffiella cohnii]
MYTIGKLAKLSNVTVRTLRYYDEIGLLKPSVKTDGGHRQYTEEDVTTLHYIITLKELGFQLETIHEILKNKQIILEELLQLRLDILKAEREKIAKMEHSIHMLLDLSAIEKSTNWYEIFEVFHSYKVNDVDINKWREKYFSNEEQKVLKKLPALGDGSEITNQWIELINDIRENINVDRNSDVAFKLVESWLTLANNMYQGNVELSKKSWKFVKGGNEKFGFYQFDSEIISFIEESMTNYFNKSGREL